MESLIVAAMSAVRCAARRDARSAIASREIVLKWETIMRKILMIALGVSLIAASSVQTAAAAERHNHARKVIRAPTSQQWQQFRDSHNSLDWPVGNSLSRLYNEGNS
jgi:hypothetical protein